MSIPILIFATSKTRMKKFILIILTLLYAVVSSGITVNVHYCMGRMADVEWGSASACTMCGQKKTSDCCKDEAHYIKLAVDQDVNHVVVTNLVPVVTELLPVLYAGFLSLEVEDTCQSFIAFDSPPKQKGVPLFVYHCTYLI